MSGDSEASAAISGRAPPQSGHDHVAPGWAAWDRTVACELCLALGKFADRSWRTARNGCSITAMSGAPSGRRIHRRFPVICGQLSCYSKIGPC